MKKLIWSLAVVSVLVCVLCKSVLADTVVYSQPYFSSNGTYSDLNYTRCIVGGVGCV